MYAVKTLQKNRSSISKGLMVEQPGEAPTVMQSADRCYCVIEPRLGQPCLSPPWRSVFWFQTWPRTMNQSEFLTGNKTDNNISSYRSNAYLKCLHDRSSARWDWLAPSFLLYPIKAYVCHTMHLHIFLWLVSNCLKPGPGSHSSWPILGSAYSFEHKDADHDRKNYC